MRYKITKLLISLISLCSIVFPAFAITTLPKQARVPGGVAIIDLEVNSAEPPIVNYLGNRTMVVPIPQKPNAWRAIVGIPLNATLGKNKIEIQTKQRKLIKNFVVKKKQYPVQRLTIKDHAKVEPPAEITQQIETEYLETIKTYANWQFQELSSLKLNMPVKGRRSSRFGVQRILNDIPKNPHSGLDIAARAGTQITCPKDGKVVNIGNYYYSGNMVFVDHGQGFITSYAHMQSVAVTKGQDLKRGDVIGAVGNTGRATGPHLHWSVSLNGVRVDPELFIHE